MQAVKLTSDENKLVANPLYKEDNGEPLQVPGIWWTSEDRSPLAGPYGVYGDYIAPKGIITEQAYPIEYFTADNVDTLGKNIFAEFDEHVDQDAANGQEIMETFDIAIDAITKADIAREKAWADL